MLMLQDFLNSLLKHYTLPIVIFLIIFLSGVFRELLFKDKIYRWYWIKVWFAFGMFLAIASWMMAAFELQ
jgi:hypothetical protein